MKAMLETARNTTATGFAVSLNGLDWYKHGKKAIDEN